MALELIQNYWLGFAITALPGAVFFETIRRTLVNKTSIYSFLSGSFSGTFLIMVCVFLGLSSILANKSMANLFYGFSALVLIYIGLTSVINKSISAQKPNRNGKKSFYTPFITGLILGAANPISILFWISTIGKMLQSHQSIMSAALNSLLIILGAMSVYIILVPVTSHSKKLFKANNLLLLSRTFGVVILGYGLLTLSKVFSY